MSLTWLEINNADQYRISNNFTTTSGGIENILIRFPIDTKDKFSYSLSLELLQCTDGFFKCELSTVQSVESVGTLLGNKRTNKSLPDISRFLAYKGASLTPKPPPYEPFTFYIGNTLTPVNRFDVHNAEPLGNRIYAGNTDVQLKFTNLDSTAANLVCSLIVIQSNNSKINKVRTFK